MVDDRTVEDYNDALKQRKKPANKKSSPKMSLTEEKIAGGR